MDSSLSTGRWYFRNGTVVKDAESQYDLMSEIEELPDFQRIDWERLRDCFEKASNGYVSSHLHVAVKEYNSTLPTALVPLPKEMPKEYNSLATPYQVWLQVQQEYGTPANNLQPLPKATPYEFVGLFNETHSPRKIWDWVVKHYGTPEPKPELPTVEELAKEMLNVWNVNTFNEVAEYVINKYSLHAREWWQGDFKGLKVKTSIGAIKELDGKLYVRLDVGVFTTINNCTPYTPPTASEIIAKHNLSEEEIRAIREGKCT